MEHVIEVRARYPECDPMGVVHHTVYPVWFEMGRTELLRSVGGSYRDLEEAGALLAVTRLEVRYRAPARYDGGKQGLQMDHTLSIFCIGHMLEESSNKTNAKSSENHI